MVRVDLDRDYYGDLELSPSATAQDVKNQFRKLGRLTSFFERVFRARFSSGDPFADNAQR